MTTLSEIAQINPRLTAQLKEHDPISFLGMADVSEAGDTSQGEERLFAEVKKGYTPFLNGDLLVAKITPCFENGKIAQARTVHTQAFGSTEFHVVRVDEAKADPRFILHLLRGPNVRTSGAKRMTGSAGQKRVPKAFLETLDIPLPPLPEQRRIADILDRADNLRAQRRRALALLEKLVLGRVTEITSRDDWPVVNLDEVATTQGGLTVNRKRDRLPEKFPYLRVANVARGAVDLTEVKTIGVTENEIERVLLEDGDILIVEGHGNESEVGRAARWSGTGAMLHQNHLIRVRVDSDELDPIFAEAFINGVEGRSYFRSVSKTTSGLNTINMSNVKSLPLRLPPIEIQRGFAAQVGQIMLLQQEHHEHLAQLDELFASLQHRAFRGEL